MFCCCKYRQSRSSHQRCSIKKGVLRNFTKFTGKHRVRVSFLKFLRTPFFTEHLRTAASDKAQKNFAIIWIYYCMSELLAEVCFSNPKSKTYLESTHSIEKIIQANLNCCKKLKHLTSLKNIYPKAIERKFEHQGNHASFLDCDINIEDSIFVYELFQNIVFSYTNSFRKDMNFHWC